MLDIQTRVYSRIKNRYSKSLMEKFPDTTFTTDDRVSDNPKFPTVYIHEMSSVEQGNDLLNEDIYAVLSTFQIEVYDNASMENAKMVMDDVVATMKSMKFNVISMPEFKNNQDVYRTVARFRRMIGSLDTL